MALDISSLTEAASANARGVAGASRPRPSAPAAARPKATGKAKTDKASTAKTTKADAAAATDTAVAPRSRPSSKRRMGTVRLSLDVPQEDAEAFRTFATARRHSHETVFRVMVELLGQLERGEYLDIAEGLD